MRCRGRDKSAAADEWVGDVICPSSSRELSRKTEDIASQVVHDGQLAMGLRPVY